MHPDVDRRIEEFAQNYEAQIRKLQREHDERLQKIRRNTAYAYVFIITFVAVSFAVPFIVHFFNQ